MKTVSLSGALRADVGKKDAKKHRREGKIPCVLYGGKEQVHFVLNELDFGKLVFTADVYLVVLNIDGKEQQAVLFTGSDLLILIIESTTSSIHTKFFFVLLFPINLRSYSIG